MKTKVSIDFVAKILSQRLDVVSEAASRTRYILIAGLIASSALISVMFNAYLSWIRISFAFMALPQAPRNANGLPQAWHGTEETVRFLRERLLVSWIDSHTVLVPILGIKISTSDATILGSTALAIISTWLFFASRRENFSIAAAFAAATSVADNTIKDLDVADDKDTPEDAAAKRRALLESTFMFVTSQLVFTVLKDDRPYTTLKVPDTTAAENVIVHRIQEQQGGVHADNLDTPWSRTIRRLASSLIFIPPLAVFLSLSLDCITLAYPHGIFQSPFRLYSEFGKTDRPSQQIAVLAILSFGFLGLFVCFRNALAVLQFDRGTRNLIREVAQRLYPTKDPEAATDGITPEHAQESPSEAGAPPPPPSVED